MLYNICYDAMETFTELKPLVPNPGFKSQRKMKLAGLTDDLIDQPIVSIVNRLNALPFCFTLQSCFGHFLHQNQPDQHNLEPLPKDLDIGKIEYRIAYLAFALDDSPAGAAFLQSLQSIAALDMENIQLGCAEWFWQQQINSYALQVEPSRLKNQDRVILDYQEALTVESARNRFFDAIDALL